MIVTQKQLDDTDKEIIRLLASGMTAMEIGIELDLSNRSVERRIVIMRKWYKCNSQAQLVGRLINEINKLQDDTSK